MAAFTTVALSDADTVRLGLHLGYPQINVGSSLVFSFPVLTTPQYLYESQVLHLREACIPRVMHLMNVLDGIECKMEEAALRGLPAEQANGIKFNRSEYADLNDMFVQFAYKLAEACGIPVCPWSERFKRNGPVGNMRVG
jgi:hypothetical protein